MSAPETTDRANEDRIHRSFETAPVAMLIFDKEARLQKMNQAAQSVFSCPNTEEMPLPGEVLDCVNALIGRGCGTNPDCGRCTVRAVLEQALGEGKEVFQKEAALNACGDDHAVTRHYLLSTVISDEDSGREVLLSLLDVTPMKEAEIQLRQVNQKLNILGSFTRHDVLNSTTAAMGYLDLIRMSEILDEKRDNYMSRAFGSLEGIVSFMEFHRNYQELGSKSPAWHNIVDLVSSAHSHWDSLELQIDDSLRGVEIYSDPLIRRVFYNLMDNSVRHGETVTKIIVRLEQDDVECSIIWEDDGIGVAEDMKELLFERGMGKNSGLGLFLVREILAITDIQISEEGAPGEGARFRLRLPSAGCRMA